MISGHPDIKGDEESALPEAEESSGTDTEAHSRIAQAGRKVRDEARRLLALESAPRKRASSRRKTRLPKAIASALSREEKEKLIEVTDGAEQPLLCMAPEAALKQGLPCRLVAVALNRRANRLLLHKGRDARLGHSGCWDLHTGFVMVGEAREDAALRLLAQAGLSGLPVKPLPVDGYEESSRFHRTFFSAELPPGLYPRPLHAEPASALSGKNEGGSASPAAESSEVLELDMDEFFGLTARAPELFTPEVLCLARSGALFGS